MAEGTVKWFDDTRGFGFISQPGGEDIFVHFSAIQDGNTVLREGQRVRFDIVQSLKGNKATNVKVIEPRQANGHPNRQVKSGRRF